MLLNQRPCAALQIHEDNTVNLMQEFTLLPRGLQSLLGCSGSAFFQYRPSGLQ
jgi:hypothetical protein